MFRYEETVSFHPVVQFLYLLGMAGVVWVQVAAVAPLPWVPVVIGVALILLPLIFGRLLIRVDADVLTAELGYLGWPIQRVPITNIVRARVVTYRPIVQFGGWGIRAGRLDGDKTSVYTVRGTTGVLLELAEEQKISGFRSKRFLIGSLEPERLVAVLGKA
ncbi:MAG: hypothetical protein BMS9Abin37_0447 [Acidobacteriota bacterium]|nr:MAG: hypothetical protein BMS9Abin37_0447 [Acidobacteriota bacterium]